MLECFFVFYFKTSSCYCHTHEGYMDTREGRVGQHDDQTCDCCNQGLRNSESGVMVFTESMPACADDITPWTYNLRHFIVVICIMLWFCVLYLTVFHSHDNAEPFGLCINTKSAIDRSKPKKCCSHWNIILNTSEMTLNAVILYWYRVSRLQCGLAGLTV